MKQPRRAGCAWLCGFLLPWLACVGVPTGETDPAGSAATANPPAGSPVSGFEVSKTGIKLLAFSIRLDRIAATTGLPLTDPAYATLRENRLLLGDHDYANAKPPQESWSAARLVTWVESVRPVCQSPAVLARFSPMPAKLPALIPGGVRAGGPVRRDGRLHRRAEGVDLYPGQGRRDGLCGGAVVPGVRGPMMPRHLPLLLLGSTLAACVPQAPPAATSPEPAPGSMPPTTAPFPASTIDWASIPAPRPRSICASCR